MTNPRVQHRTSGQYGTRMSEGIWYSAVEFDGEDGTSWVANDSLVAVGDGEPPTHD